MQTTTVGHPPLRNDVPAFDRLQGAFVWGYGHFPIFGVLAAFGAGIHVAISAIVIAGGTVAQTVLAQRSMASLRS